jgi:LPS O-antigen subunit length determinant protein (WzzB/FepE family)
LSSQNKKYHSKTFDNADYYFSLKDLLDAFIKRKMIIIIVFIIGYSFHGISFLYQPDSFKLEQKINFNSHSLISNFSDSQKGYDAHIRKVLITEFLSRKNLFNEIELYLSDKTLNHELANKLTLRRRHQKDFSPIFLNLETNQPEVDIKKFTSFIDLMNNKISIDFKSGSISKISQMIAEKEAKIEILQYERKAVSHAKIALLEEAKAIAVELNIVDPATNIISENRQLWTLGAEYLQAEVNILKNRKNDELFIFLDEPEVANIKRELEFYQNINLLGLDLTKVPQVGKYASPKNNEQLQTTIQLLKLELKSHAEKAKFHRSARIAMLEENIEFANNFGIIKPILKENLSLNGLYSTSSFDSVFSLDDYRIILGDYADEKYLDNDLSAYDKNYAYPLSNHNFKQQSLSWEKALLGSKYLSKMINVLKKRESQNGEFAKNIYDNKHYISFLNSALTRINSVDYKPFKYEAEYLKVEKINKNLSEGLIRLSSILLILGISLMLLVIFLKNDLRIKDKLL